MLARGFLSLLPALAIASGALAMDRQLQIAPTTQAPSGEKRIALVIGNSAYKTSPLKNPVNDARSISKALAQTGFKVLVIEDASQATMRRAIRNFGNEIQNGGVGLFYYAGHGMQVKGKNYLIPVNADIEHEDEIEDQAVDANLVLSKMDTAKSSLNLMILDACRNNPFARSFRSGTQGLAQMEAPSGTLVAFATAPGAVAADGDGSNGLYTKHLLANIARPGLAIEQLFKDVRIGVTRETQNRQVPWESSSLTGDFYFTPGAATADRKREIEQAVAHAVRAEQDKLAEQQRRLEQTIRELLAKQRADLEEEMKRRGERVAAAPAVVPAPAAPATQVASVAPSSAASVTRDLRLPATGDRWEYRYVDTYGRKARKATFEVTGVSPEGILEKARMEGTADDTRAHSAGVELYFGEFWELSPYLMSFQSPRPGESWSSVPHRNWKACLLAGASCRFHGSVSGRERIKTPAGTFDALKVVIDLSARGLPGGYSNSSSATWRQLTFWYSEQAKRLVKAEVRTRSGPTLESDYDLELVSYKLN